MSTPNAIIEDVQCVYFDLCDLLEKLDCQRIKLKEFDEFKNLEEFIEEQKRRVSNLEDYLTGGA
ncbi:hypothetical protein CCP3SC15_260038 [Gammaproteobacteria bacterium]